MGMIFIYSSVVANEITYISIQQQYSYNLENIGINYRNEHKHAYKFKKLKHNYFNIDESRNYKKERQKAMRYLNLLLVHLAEAMLTSSSTTNNQTTN